MRKFIIPVILVMTGAGAAFATNVNKAPSSTIVDGYRKTSDPMHPCDNSKIECSTVETTVCTDALNVPLYDFNGSGCPSQLYKP